MTLDVKDLSVSYGPISAVRQVALEVNPGEIVALIGANGAGKTTILKTISGLLRSHAGEIRFGDINITKMKPHKIVDLGISHVPERRGIFANLTVYENLLMGAFTRDLRAVELDEVYELFPILKERRKQVAGTLSGGEQQMLAISRALLSKPRLMLLDEPSLGLAPQISKNIFETIQRINSAGTTVLLVEQNAHAALRISHRGYVLEVGEIVCADKSENLLKNDLVKKAYLGEN
ncbi:MAG: ABC transporter ATP-binding protein [Deltaproteobacteria bacterium]|nr:ABC transporter ATP-binding protein [Deltaproteobacteria bacterium]